MIFPISLKNSRINADCHRCPAFVSVFCDKRSNPNYLYNNDNSTMICIYISFVTFVRGYISKTLCIHTPVTYTYFSEKLKKRDKRQKHIN